MMTTMAAMLGAFRSSSARPARRYASRWATPSWEDWSYRRFSRCTRRRWSTSLSRQAADLAVRQEEADDRRSGQTLKRWFCDWPLRAKSRIRLFDSAAYWMPYSSSPHLAQRAAVEADDRRVAEVGIDAVEAGGVGHGDVDSCSSRPSPWRP